MKCLLLGVALILGGCTSISQTKSSNGEKLVSSLTTTQVKQIASARARENGFAASASDAWSLSLAVEPQRVWTAMLTSSLDGPPKGYWILIDDATGHGEFVMPIVKVANIRPAGSDWLFKVRHAIDQLRYPTPIEDLLRQINLAGLEADGGGTSEDGRMYLEYTLRRERDEPARFVLRCYIQPIKTWAEPKILTEARIYYMDAHTMLYLLSREEP